MNLRSLFTRVGRAEGRIPGFRGRKITEIIESIVTPNPIIGGAPIVEEIRRENLLTGEIEVRRL
jgi:hypothetical protein